MAAKCVIIVESRVRADSRHIFSPDTYEWVLAKLVPRERREAIESAAEVGMPAGQPDMNIWRWPDHPRNPAITARSIATGVSRRIRTLPPDGRTTSIAATP